MQPTVFNDARGSLRLSWLRTNVLCTEIEGHFSVDLVEDYMREVSAAYARGVHIHHFFDAERLTTYDSDTRVRMTDFAIRNRKQVSAAVFLLAKQNRLLTMGVTTASLAARLVGLEFEVTYVRADFEERLRRASASTARSSR